LWCPILSYKLSNVLEMFKNVLSSIVLYKGGACLSVCLMKHISAFTSLSTSFYGPYDNIWSYGLLHGWIRFNKLSEWSCPCALAVSPPSTHWGGDWLSPRAGVWMCWQRKIVPSLLGTTSHSCSPWLSYCTHRRSKRAFNWIVIRLLIQLDTASKIGRSLQKEGLCLCGNISGIIATVSPDKKTLTSCTWSAVSVPETNMWISFLRGFLNTFT
jgi:hypothetical protein